MAEEEADSKMVLSATFYIKFLFCLHFLYEVLQDDTNALCTIKLH